MRIGEAVEYDQQFWHDMGTMSADVQDRTLARVEGSADFDQVQSILDGLSVVGASFATAIKARIDDLKTLPMAETTEPFVLAEQLTKEAKTGDIEIICEPIEGVPEYLTGAKSRDVVTALFLQDKFAEFRRIKAETQRQAAKTGPSKIARLKRAEERQIEQLFYMPVEGRSDFQRHIAADPTAFAAVGNAIIRHAEDQTLAKDDRRLFNELGTKFLGSGKDYVAMNADQLRQADYYLPDLLARYTEEMLVSSSTRRAAGHLLRGFFITADTPERSVSRLNSVLEAMVASYHNRELLRVIATDIFLWRADFMRSNPVFENLLAASEAHHQPDLAADAHQLLQFPVMYLNHNLDLGDDQTVQRVIDQMQRSKVAQLAAALKVVTQTARLQLPDYERTSKRYVADADLIARSNSKGNKKDREGGMQAYLESVGGQPGPAYTDLFLKPHKSYRNFMRKQSVMRTYRVTQRRTP